MNKSFTTSCMDVPALQGLRPLLPVGRVGRYLAPLMQYVLFPPPPYNFSQTLSLMHHLTMTTWMDVPALAGSTPTLASRKGRPVPNTTDVITIINNDEEMAIALDRLPLVAYTCRRGEDGESVQVMPDAPIAQQTCRCSRGRMDLHALR